ncbi:ROK family transcriptional regulator [Chromobacterium sp. IIBBL 290-4]|uniref:ROK family transcriptional regulator n=1 Tax=Chromobacterium sp. IIBBL 290-4 TaxID=2953890 RepID=UPI0020B704B1|nr:ROK family transcriptional regulator [Chromobacterium sp. IIBBL 290-4]UTH73670.1 ROK family transcriptional regulator [Chromobacterium sp. IIBBL 290-4]
MKLHADKPEALTVSGTNLEHARSHNRRAVLETIRRNQRLTRAELARLTALTPQTVSNITAELLEAGILLAGAPVRDGARGQPAIPLSLNPDGAYSIGVQLDHRHLIAVMVDMAGVLRARVETPVDRPSPKQALPVIKKALSDLKAQSASAWERLLGMGLVMPGPFGVQGMTSVGPTTLPGWEAMDATQLSAALGMPVRLEKDATAAAIGERLYGSASTLQNYVYLFVGTGLGAGLFLDGSLYAGGRHNAGEIGHMIVEPDGLHCECGNRGCLERYVSLRALGECMRLPDDNEALRALLAQPPLAGDAWLRQAAPRLRQAINILECLLDIEAVVIGGLLPPAWQQALVDSLHPLASSTRSSQASRLRLGSAGRDVVALGAAALPIFDEFNPQYEVLLKRA